MRYNAPVQRLSEATAIEQYPRLKREERRNNSLPNGDRTMTHRDVLDVTTRVASLAAKNMDIFYLGACEVVEACKPGSRACRDF